MKFKNFLLVALAAIATIATSCSNEEKEAACGVVAATVLPAGSAKAYSYTVNATEIINSNDSIVYDITTSALKNAVLKVVPTLNTTVSVNGEAIGDSGIVVDVTKDITLTCNNGVKTTTYTLKTLIAESAQDGLINKATSFAGIEGKVIWMDVAEFKGAYYAAVAAMVDSIEHYDLYKSSDFVAWEKVAYSAGDSTLIGGEGARLVAMNDKLYVLSGMRSRGADIYGNPAEVEDGWFGPSPTINAYRVFESKDGQNFTCLTDNMEFYRTNAETGEEELVERISWGADVYATSYSKPYGNFVVFKDKLFAQGGYSISFGMAQGSMQLYTSTDCKKFVLTDPVDAEAGFVNLPAIGATMFEFQGKLWVVGGFSSFLSPSYVSSSVYCSEDGKVWEKVAEEETENVPQVWQGKAVTNGEVIYLYGGESYDEEGVTYNFSDVIYKSTDGKKWEVVETPARFEGYRLSSAVATGKAAWFIGGFKTPSTGYYACPAETDEFATDVWNIAF